VFTESACAHAHVCAGVCVCVCVCVCVRACRQTSVSVFWAEGGGRGPWELSCCLGLGARASHGTVPPLLLTAKTSPVQLRKSGLYHLPCRGPQRAHSKPCGLLGTFPPPSTLCS
jgi:hypothetical protein